MEIIAIQCTSEVNGNHPIAEGVYPTGCWVSLSEEFVRDTFNADAATKIIANKVVNLNMDLWAKLGLPSIVQTKSIAAPLLFKETVFVEK
jgi:hypothetical protein